MTFDPQTALANAARVQSHVFDRIGGPLARETADMLVAAVEEVQRLQKERDELDRRNTFLHEQCDQMEGERDRYHARIAELATAIWGEPQPDMSTEETLRQAVDQRVAFDAIDAVRAERDRLAAEVERLKEQLAAYEKLPGHIYPIEGGGTVIGMTVCDDAAEKGA